MIPKHVGEIGNILEANYFSPGIAIIHGKPWGSLWAIAYWDGKEYRYERSDLGQPWVRTK